MSNIDPKWCKGPKIWVCLWGRVFPWAKFSGSGRTKKIFRSIIFAGGVVLGRGHQVLVGGAQDFSKTAFFVDSCGYMSIYVDIRRFCRYVDLPG